MSVETYTSAAPLAQLAIWVLLLGSSTHWAFNVTKEAKAKNSKESFFMSTVFYVDYCCKIRKNRFFAENFVAMVDKFSNEEQTAIASVLYNLADADFQNHEAERECLEACMKELEFDATGFVPVPKNELQKQVYETLKRMSKEKKRSFSLMMTKLSRSDAHFGKRERDFVMEILNMCNVPFVHK
jgi:uncharacterized tellurite resistance protein B-like protein